MADAPILIRGPMTLAYWLFFRGLALRRYARSIHPDLDENLKVWQVRSAVGDDPRFRALCRARWWLLVGAPPVAVLVIWVMMLLVGKYFVWRASVPFSIGCSVGALVGDLLQWVSARSNRRLGQNWWMIAIFGVGIATTIQALFLMTPGWFQVVFDLPWVSPLIANDSLPIRYFLSVGALFGVTFGVAFGVAGGVAFGVSFSMIGGMVGGAPVVVTFGIALGMAIGVAFGVVPDMALGVVFGAASGVGVSEWVGRSVGIVSISARGMLDNVIISIAFGFVFSVVGGRVRGVVGGLAFGLAFGIAINFIGVIAFLIAFTIAFLRLPFYLLELLRAMWLSAEAERAPTRAADLWRLQPFHYDDMIQLPLLGLPEHLAAIARSDPDACLNALADTGASLRQHWAIPRALSLILHNELCRCTTLALIARFAEATAWLPSERFNADEQELLRALRNISANCTGALVGHVRETRERGLREQAEQVRKVRTNLGKLSGLQQGLCARKHAESLERWQRVFEAETAQVAHERIQSGELPMRYSAGAILETDDTAFQGRADIFRTLEELLVSAPNKITPLLLGQPRTGKSSVLKQLPRRLGTHVLPVFINMESRAVAADAAGLLLDLSADIRAAAAQHAHPLDLPPLDEAALRNDPYRLFENWIRTIETLLGTERWLLLTLDEFNRIDDAVRGGRLDERIFFTLRNLIQHHPRIALALSGTFTLAECDPRWYEALKSVQTLPVSYLRPDEARNLLVKPAPDFPADVYSPPAIARALELTNGHPYLLHLLGATIVSAYNRKRADLPLGAPADTPLPADAIDDAIPDLLRSGENALMSIWQWLLRIGGAQNAATLLETLARDQPIATLGDPDQRAELLALYCDRDLLAHDEHGNYHYRVPLLAHWIRAQRRLPRQ